jgi:hypothetical protein
MYCYAIHTFFIDCPFKSSRLSKNIWTIPRCGCRSHGRGHSGKFDPPGGGGSHIVGSDPPGGGGHTVGFTSHKCSSQRSRGRGHIGGSDPQGEGHTRGSDPPGGPHRRIRSSGGATLGDRFRIWISRQIRIYMPNGSRVWIGGLRDEF